MRRAHHIVCFIGVVGAYVSINAEPIGFHITASVDPQHIQVAFQITVDDSDAPGDQTERDLAIQQYEEAPRQVNNQIKHEAFAAYLVQREFVKAERLAEEMIVSDEISSREAAYYVLGVAKVCRGDYEAAVAAFRSAQPSYRQAACFRVYISCLILREPEEVEHLVKAMLKTNEANTSRVAADAILGVLPRGKGRGKSF